MKIDEAMLVLTSNVGSWEDRDKAIRMALTALKKQKRMKPIYTKGNGILCPSCKCLSLLSGKYCMHCGQAIDWSEVK